MKLEAKQRLLSSKILTTMQHVISQAPGLLNTPADPWKNEKGRSSQAAILKKSFAVAKDVLIKALGTPAQTIGRSKVVWDLDSGQVVLAPLGPSGYYRVVVTDKR